MENQIENALAESKVSTSEEVPTNNDISLADVPIDEYIENVIKLTKEKYPEYASDEIIEKITNILKKVDDDTRISVIKNYRKSISEYHRYDDIEGALGDVERTQREVTDFLNKVNHADSQQVLEVRKVMEQQLLNNLGVHFATPTDAIDMNTIDMNSVGNFDMDEFRKDLTEAKAIAHIFKAVYEAAYRRKMAQCGDNHSLTDDVVEQLMHDRDTLAASKDINKNLKIKIVDDVIDAVENPSFQPIENKTLNETGLKNIYKEYRRDISKAKKLIKKAGFTDAMVDNVTKFFVEESTFANTYSIPQRRTDTINPAALKKTVEFFIYHIARICDSSRKKNGYIGIVYKMYILRVLEVETTVAYSNNFDERYPDMVETEESKIRSDLYEEYLHLFLSHYGFIYEESVNMK